MQGLTGLQSSSWRWQPSQQHEGRGVMIKSSGKEDLSLRVFSGVYHCLLFVFKSYLADIWQSSQK